MINNIEKKNTINEALAKQKLNALNEIKKAETKNRRLINGQKVLLNLFDELVEAIFNNNKIVSEDNNKIAIEDNKKIVTEDNNKTVSKDNNKIVIEYNFIDDNNDDNNDNNDNNNDKITVKETNNNF